MANPLSGILGKIKTVGGKAVDIAGKGALYSQMYRNPNEKLTIGQRVGGAVTDMALNATLGQMGSLGQAMNAGMLARGKGTTTSPTGGGGVPNTPIQATPIKTANVVQAINQSTQQMLNGLNILNSTFRSGLNNTTNQVQAQASVMGSVKRDTEDMSISLREIYEVLNRMGYQDKSKHNLFGGGTPIGDNVTKSQSGNSLIGSLLNGLLMQKLLEKALPSMDLPDADKDTKKGKGGGLSRLFKRIPLGKVAGGIGGLLGGLALDYGADYATESGYEKTGAGLGILSNILSGAGAGGLAGAAFGGVGAIPGAIVGGLGGLGYGLYDKGSSLFGMGETDGSKVPTVAKTGRSQSSQSYDTSELTKAEIDEIFRLAPINAGDDVLFEIAKQKFPGRKYNTLKQRIEMLRSLMQPQSSLSTGVKVASADMSSGNYLVNRQKMLENARSGTSEQALRQEEQKLEQNAFESIIPDLMNYESRELMYKADNITFDAGKIEFLQGMGMGVGGEEGVGAMGLGADRWRDGGTQARDGSGIGGGDATKVPPKTLSSEQQQFFSDLEKGNIDASSSRADFLKGMTPDQLNQMGLKTVTAKDGTTQYAKADVSDQQAVESLKKKAASGGKFVQGGSFEENSPVLMQRLMKDFNLTPEQAAGIVGNLGHESAGLQAGIQEKNPVGGGRGGLGWAQWTGPRRREFEAYLERTGQKATDPEANYGFLKEELEGSESAALNKLRKTSNVEDATVAFEQGYERAGIKHYGPRKDYANKAIQGYQANPNVGKMTPEELANFKPTQEQIAAEKENIEKQRKQARVDIAGTSSNQPAMAGVGPGNVAVKEAYGPRRPERPDESIRNIGSSAAGAAGMSNITFTSGKGDWISDAGKAKGQTFTWHQTGKALDVSGFSSDEERLRFIEEAAARGANGIGVYKDGSIHIDQREGGSTWSWGGIDKKIVDAAVARGKKKREQTMADEKKKLQDAEKQKNNVKVEVKEESGAEKAYEKFGLKPKGKEEEKTVADNQTKKAETSAAIPLPRPRPEQPSAPPTPAAPIAANPAMVDPTSAQSAQKVAELSKKTTMNREAATKQGPVTQNIVNNSNPKADTTGTGFPDKNAPMMAMTDTMEKFTSHLFGVA